MGVAWVFESTQNARSIEQIFEQSGAVLSGVAKSFRADCIGYRPQQHISNVISDFYVLHNSNFPDSAFIINIANKNIEQQANQQSGRFLSRATADKGFELQLDKFQNAGLAAEPIRFEVVGNEYKLKDFRLRVGTATIGTHVKGVIVELEFAPSNIVFQCQSLLYELMETFFPGQSMKPPEVFLQHSLQPDNYQSIDTAQQYLDLYLLMRKRS